ncbi:flavodoxin family protein [Thermobrachium celere]|uniref:flavodoxin family protein n=1 Tax=Thermobrachium celere TaxID=53422 RepID=UPI001942318A|nr:flavodoxin family protein [Thermobrachium celere]GFR34354.1 hypothetical protein TCEA9_01660 [Thermobrachium celere]
MNIVVLNGSYNKKGTTYKLLEKFINKIDGKKHSIYLINTYDLNINYCIGCRNCEKTGECIYRDMDNLYEIIEKADLVVISSPVYFGSFTSPLKVLIDRLQVIYAKHFVLNKSLKPKKGIFIFTAGRKSEKMLNSMVLQAKYVFLSLNAEFLDCIYQLNTDEVKELDEKVLEKLEEVVKKI